jgi:hypothetical protein
MNGGTCLHETPGKRLPSGRKKNVRCNRSSLLTNSLPYKEGQAIAVDFSPQQRINGTPREAVSGPHPGPGPCAPRAALSFPLVNRQGVGFHGSGSR